LVLHKHDDYLVRTTTQSINTSSPYSNLGALASQSEIYNFIEMLLKFSFACN